MKRVHTFPCEIVKLCNFAIVHVYVVKLEVGLVDDDFPSEHCLQGPFAQFSTARMHVWTCASVAMELQTARTAVL